MPSRYEPTGGALQRRWAREVETAIPYAEWLATTVIEAIVFGAAGGILRRWLRATSRPRIEAVDRAFEAGFYVRQFSDAWRRERLERDPLLHYVIVGAREGRSPTPRFDPAFAKRRQPDVHNGLERFLVSCRAGANSEPCNEVEEGGDRGPWRLRGSTVLSFHHARGGGSTEFLARYEAQLRAAGKNVLRLRAVPLAETLAVIEDPVGERPSRVFDLDIGRQELVDFARERGVDRLLVNHLVDRPAAALDWVRDLSVRLQCPYDVILHDYYALCPRIDLVDGGGQYCGVAPVEKCVGCVSANGSEVLHVDARTWRRDFLEFVRNAETVVVPSHHLKSRMKEHLGCRPIAVWAPEQDDAYPPETTPRIARDEALRVVTLGALSVSKGSRVVRALTLQAAASAVPMTIEVLGPSSEPQLLRRAGVSIAGLYRPQSLDAMIARARPHIVFLPAVWPETWSFVLTEALQRGLPVVAFDIGAPAERLRRLGRGHLLPLELATRPADLLAAFVALRARWMIP